MNSTPENHALTALSPLDGRYAHQTEPLKNIFSEFGLMKNRILVELHWLQTLADCKDIPEVHELSDEATLFLENLINHFSIAQAADIKTIEKTTNHDLKAIEYFLKKEFSKNAELSQLSEFIHFACTSEDINNLAYGLMVQEGLNTVLLPAIHNIHQSLKKLAHTHAEQAMLSRTHGQPATPTTVGKEFANVVYRLERQMMQLHTQEIMGKCNGAVGNFNAHLVAYPNLDWLALSKKFVTNLGLTYNPYTTQIEPHDYLAEMSHTVERINSIIIDLSRDIWGYISIGYFKQKMVSTEVGSSTMPHKINPIDFENAEGNAGIANALLHHFATKLPISRFQRDLSDSTVLRNLGVAFGHCLLAYSSLTKGLGKIEVDKLAIETDLKDRWELLAEPVQTIMRRAGIPEPYEQLKRLSRGQQITRESLHTFIHQLDCSADTKKELLALTPLNYTGLATRLVKEKTRD